MEWIPFRPPRIGLKVRYQGDGTARGGIYTIVANDEYNMVGFVVIEDIHGNRFGRDARMMEPAE